MPGTPFTGRVVNSRDEEVTSERWEQRWLALPALWRHLRGQARFAAQAKNRAPSNRRLATTGHERPTVGRFTIGAVERDRGGFGQGRGLLAGVAALLTRTWVFQLLHGFAPRHLPRHARCRSDCRTPVEPRIGRQRPKADLTCHYKSLRGEAVSGKAGGMLVRSALPLVISHIVKPAAKPRMMVRCTIGARSAS